MQQMSPQKIKQTNKQNKKFYNLTTQAADILNILKFCLNIYFHIVVCEHDFKLNLNLLLLLLLLLDFKQNLFMAAIILFLLSLFDIVSKKRKKKYLTFFSL